MVWAVLGILALSNTVLILYIETLIRRIQETQRKLLIEQVKLQEIHLEYTSKKIERNEELIRDLRLRINNIPKEMVVKNVLKIP